MNKFIALFAMQNDLSNAKQNHRINRCENDSLVNIQSTYFIAPLIIYIYIYFIFMNCIKFIKIK